MLMNTLYAHKPTHTDAYIYTHTHMRLNEYTYTEKQRGMGRGKEGKEGERVSSGGRGDIK